MYLNLFLSPVRPVIPGWGFCGLRTIVFARANGGYEVACRLPPRIIE
jgi:hypothetical protein